MKKSIATLVRSLTEENPQETDDDLSSTGGAVSTVSKYSQIKVRSKKEVMEYLDTPLFINTMTEAYLDLQHVDDDPELQKTDCDFEELKGMINEVGFAYFHILCRMSDLDENVNKDTLLKPDSNQETAWNFFSENTLSIEILKNDVLQKIYFPVEDKNVLREEIKDKFKYEVDRTSPSNKIRDFMDWASDIIHDIQYQKKIHAIPIARLMIKLWLPMNYIAVFLSFIIAVLIMIFWRQPTDASGVGNPSNPVPQYWYSEVEIVIYVLGGIHNFISFCILITFYLSNHPSFPVINTIKSLIKKHEHREITDDMSWLEKKEEYSYLEVKAYGINSVYYVVFLVFSVLGTAFYGYFFAFHLLHIAVLNQLLKRVIQAVTTNGTSLLLVGMLGMVIIFIYALVSFAILREKYLLSSLGRHCTTVYECFITVLHHGFVDSLYTSFEGNMETWNTTFKEHLILTAVDLTFFIIVTTIGLNIIFGIIVDTFSQLRDSKWEIDKDMMNNCFICSRESYDFERQLSGGFERHVKEEHNQWAYLFFFLHLDNTRVNDYSALELYVYKLLQESNFDFFPLNQALSLQNEEDSQEVKLQELVKNVEYMVNKMKEEEASRERDRERQRQLEWEAQHKTK